MARPIAQPLRPLRATERQQLMQVTKSPSQALRRHRRARALLGVANGATLTAAAKEAGWRVCVTQWLPLSAGSQCLRLGGT
jgi:hypothetical protein